MYLEFAIRNLNVDTIKRLASQTKKDKKTYLFFYEF